MASRLISRSFKTLGQQLSRPSLIQTVTKSAVQFCPATTNGNVRMFSVTASKLSSVSDDLKSFLKDEIKIEKEARKQMSKVSGVTGFELKTEGADVTLSRSFNDEMVTVTFNVNHSLDSEASQEESAAEADQTPMKSRPAFTVDIKKNDKVLSFGCSFLPAEESDKSAMEDFQIDEFAIHEGDWNEKVYSVDCTVLDGQLYDILLNMLEERGMGEDFASELAEFSTSYEHLQYVGLLEKLEEFAK